MNERFSVILMLLLSFTEQVKAIYCFNALVCVIITRPRSYEGSFATSPSPPGHRSPVLRSLFLSFHHQFPNFGSLGKRVGLRETGWVLPPQLLGALGARLGPLGAVRGALVFVWSQERVLHRQKDVHGAEKTPS